MPFHSCSCSDNVFQRERVRLERDLYFSPDCPPGVGIVDKRWWNSINYRKLHKPTLLIQKKGIFKEL